MNIENLMSSVTSFVTDPQFITNAKTALLICGACFLLGCILRLLFGKRATAVRSVTVALGILITYILNHMISVSGSALSAFLIPLPFVNFENGLISIFSLAGASTEDLCYHLVNLIMLAFLFGLFDDLLPSGKNIFLWLLLRCVCILGAYVSYSIINIVFSRILPGFIITYAPILLLILLGVFLAVTVFKWLFGLILGVSGGPVLGAIYTFFISHIVGKQLTKSALTTGILYLLVHLANQLQLTSITFDTPFGSAAILTIVMLTAVWYCIYKLF